MDNKDNIMIPSGCSRDVLRQVVPLHLGSRVNVAKWNLLSFYPYYPPKNEKKPVGGHFAKNMVNDNLVM
jgi:hypothetical protein